MKLSKRLLLAFSTGYILFFYSERVFWSFARLEDSPLDYLLTPLLYTLFAYIFLILVDEFRVLSIWAIFIAGAAFGWIDEGIVAMTLFGVEGLPFPITISWTGLAWHALISVLVGWYYLRKILQENAYRKTIYFSLIMGSFWGFWSIAWGLETPPLLASIPAYLVHGLAITAFLIISQWLFTKSDPATFHATKTEKIFFAAIALLFYGFVTVPYTRISLAILPPLFVLLYVILRRNKSSEQGGSILAELGTPVRWRNSFLLFIMPITATLVYATANALNLVYRTNLFALIVTTALGFIIFGVSTIKIFRRSPDK